MSKSTLRDFFPVDGCLVALAVAACVALWHTTYPLKSKWEGLPPPTSKIEAVLYGYGDYQLAYRNIGMMLQNTGDVGGNVTNLKDYDYKAIQAWLWTTYDLDPKANYVPSLAAFYFGAVNEKQRVSYLIDYLAKVGQDPGLERWRWLAHAVYLARFEMKDYDRALTLANELAALPDPDMPIWTKQMPAFVMTKVGKKQAARDLLMTIMATDKTIDPAEINQTCWYINQHLRERTDNLEKNEVYTTFCSHAWDTQHPDTDKKNIPHMTPEQVKAAEDKANRSAPAAPADAPKR